MKRQIMIFENQKIKVATYTDREGEWQNEKQCILKSNNYNVCALCVIQSLKIRLYTEQTERKNRQKRIDKRKPFSINYIFTAHQIILPHDL